MPFLPTIIANQEPRYPPLPPPPHFKNYSLILPRYPPLWQPRHNLLMPLNRFRNNLIKKPNPLPVILLRNLQLLPQLLYNLQVLLGQKMVRLDLLAHFGFELVELLAKEGVHAGFGEEIFLSSENAEFGFLDPGVVVGLVWGGVAARGRFIVGRFRGAMGSGRSEMVVRKAWLALRGGSESCTKEGGGAWHFGIKVLRIND